MDVAEGLSSYTDLIITPKIITVQRTCLNLANGIEIYPGYGYQIKISEPIVALVFVRLLNTDNTQILDIEENNAQMQNDINCLTGTSNRDHCYGGIVFYIEEGRLEI